jgi:hypothetical protein
MLNKQFQLLKFFDHNDQVKKQLNSKISVEIENESKFSIFIELSNDGINLLILMYNRII